MSTYNDFIQSVKDNIHKIHENNKTRREVENQLAIYGINKGELQRYFNDIDTLDEIDIRAIALIGEQIYIKFGIESLDLKKTFNKNELNDIRVFYNTKQNDYIDYPIVIHDVTMIGQGSYVFPIDYKFIARLYNSNKLNYNFEVQRQPKFVKRKDRVIKAPFINQNSVKEITKHLLNGTLVPTNIVYNASLGSSNESEELIYNSKERTLTITDGTRLDILDGMHRTISCLRAYSVNKDLDFNFIGLLFNFTTKQAQNYQSQLAKANPIPKSRIQELEASRYADFVVQQLRIDSELKDRITSRDRLGKGTNELVSYAVISNAIDSTFEMKNKLEALGNYNYLSEYFTYLFGYFQEDLEQLDNGNLMFYNKMFIGHIKLAKRMKEHNIPLSNLNHILSGIDFNRENKIFKDYGIVVNGKVANKIEKSIIKLFDDIELKGK
ncbi:hypothetical protein B1B04_09345 [Lysinibacillus sp. KCTC 33748]|uniref:DNA sulfur modification protein DndB n=1 Tax=unclassified Lysinibacillus TaxID=2636778 RepID=UPI0009A67B9D|nr:MULTISPECIES: DNA sulfur modification protein DndB [unclassified Lysinibacillus]OXS74319.1 hypothetical protein B1B04_09345 [Lysinibacillus sp. KCTC 33748]SKB64239.1 DNA-sulfur modification-associated [Lysinibacillus sp. AC-3]